MMGAFILGIIFAAWCPVPACAYQIEGKIGDTSPRAVYQELLKGLPKTGVRAKSSRYALEYWLENNFPSNSVPPVVRKSVTTKDGKSAEVVFLIAGTQTFPGDGCNLAFLFIEKRVVDSAMCWHDTRSGDPKVLLEDVDGDGFADVAIRASDNRSYLCAYAITSTGFQNLLPNTEHDLNATMYYDTSDKRVTLRATGIPELEHGYQLIDCTLSAKNTSKKNIPIKPGEWYDVTIANAGYTTINGKPDKRVFLKPGESVSQVIRLIVRKYEKDLAIRWKFVEYRPVAKAH